MSKKEAKQEKAPPKRRGDRIKQHTKSPFINNGWAEDIKEKETKWENLTLRT